MLGINPYLTFKGDCREAIEFYKSALEAEVLFVQTMRDSPMSHMGPANNIMHCSLKIGDSTLMLADDPNPDDAPDRPGKISLAIGMNDPARAADIFHKLSQGGSVIMPLTKTYWAEAFGMLTDRFGIKWMINCETPSHL